MLCCSRSARPLFRKLVQHTLRLDCAPQAMQHELKASVDSISRRLASLGAALEGIEEGVVRRAAGSTHRDGVVRAPPPAFCEVLVP